MAVEHVTRESYEILVGLLFLFGAVIVVLVDLHFHWAREVEDRQDKAEQRIKALEDQVGR